MPLKLLIADLTQKNLCAEVETKLHSAGYQSLRANSVTQAIEQALVQHFDAILCLVDGPEPTLVEGMQLLQQAGYDIPLAMLCVSPCHVAEAAQHFSAPWDWAEIYAWLGGRTRSKLQKLSVPDDLQQLFLKSLTQAAAELDEALSEQNWLKIKQIVHRLKGNAACFGEGQITSLAHELQLLWEEQKVAEQDHQLGPLLTALRDRGI